MQLKPADEGQPWRRLRVDNAGTLTLRSRKLHWWVFTLDVTGHANPLSKSFDLSYRRAPVCLFIKGCCWVVCGAVRGVVRTEGRLQLLAGGGWAAPLAVRA